MTLGNIIYFAQRLTKCNFDEMYTVTLPGEGVSVNGGDYYELYPNATLKILNEHFNPNKEPLTIYDLNIRQVISGGSQGSDEPEETTRPTSSTEPEETTDPTDQTEPTESSDSSSSTEPTEPTEPSSETPPVEPPETPEG